MVIWIIAFSNLELELANARDFANWKGHPVTIMPSHVMGTSFIALILRKQQREIK